MPIRPNADSLASFAPNIEILLANVTKPEKSKILALTWPVTSSVTSGSNFWPCTGSSVQGYRMAFEVWKSVQQFGRSQGGGGFAPPPEGRVTNQTPAGRGLKNILVDTAYVAS